MPSPPGSAEEAAQTSGRFLIAAGTADYSYLPDDPLPSVRGDLDRIVDLFTRTLGYQYVLPELRENPTSGDLLERIGDWLGDEARQPSDVIVFYYSGHGAVKGRKHYLLTANSRMNNLVGTALPSEFLAGMLIETHIRQLLVILDTCYSGRGASDFSTVAAEALSSIGGAEWLASGIYAIAAAGPKQEARPGVFAEALAHVLEKPTGPYAGERQPYLDLVTLVDSINQDFVEQGVGQRAAVSSSGVTGIPPFFANLRHVQVQDGTDVKTQRRIAGASRQDLISHFGPRARGVEIEAQPGWYFTGRTAALGELVAWMTAASHDGKSRVVTGSPGSGKSAVLSRLVTLSDPEYRDQVPLDAVPPETIPPEGLIDVAIHARKKTLDHCIAAIAAKTRIAETQPELLVNALAHKDRRWVILLDALDEANDPKEIARKLLVPLSLLVNVRLLVGARRDMLAVLGPAFFALDLDDPSYVSPADLGEYVRRRLLAADDPARHTPYRDDANLAGDVAEAVGQRAYPVFLIARLISQTLIEAGGPVDTSRPEWREHFPSSVDDAFDEYVSRLGDTPRARALLRPLAYAEGTGLPWGNLWAPLASAISGQPYTDGDVEWLLEHAGAFLVEGIEDGRSVYRLYHQALADHLHSRQSDDEVQRRFARTLLEQTPDRNVGKGKDWSRASAYVTQHLAAHAAGAGILGELVADAFYLVSAEPGGLLCAMEARSTDIPAKILHVYRGAFHSLRDSSCAERASYLEMAAPERAECPRRPVRPAAASSPLFRPLGTLASGRLSLDRPPRRSGCLGGGGRVGGPDGDRLRGP